MSADYGPPSPVTQGRAARLISEVKSDTVDFETAIKGFRATGAGNVAFIPQANGAAAITVAVADGDVVSEWLIKRINSTGTTADGYTIEG